MTVEGASAGKNTVLDLGNPNDRQWADLVVSSTVPDHF